MENRHEVEIDVIDLFYYLRKRLWIILTAVAVCVAMGMGFTMFFMETEYTANTRIYVLNRSSENNVSYSDFQVSNQLLDDYVVLITGENVTKKVIETMGLNMTPQALEKMIKVTAPNDTRVIQISVTDNNAQRAASIANQVRLIASEQIKDIMAVDAVNLVYEADVPQSKSGPSLTRNAVMSALAGGVVILMVLLAVYMLDDTIRTEDDVERYLGLSVLGVIPLSSEMANMGRTAANGKNGKNSKSRPAAPAPQKQSGKKN